MTKDELIAKQQLLIEEYKKKEESNKEILDTLHYRFIGIGAPLNDNNLEMNKDQLGWCFGVKEIIDNLVP